MRLQVAIDRVSVERAEEMIAQISAYADIVEVGTSLIKEFGLEGSVAVLKERFPKQCILADIKTCDEGAYEFTKSYEAGADILTVMGFSSLPTIRACAEVAATFGKEYMIDLLEVSDAKLEVLKQEFPEAIFGVHLPSDNQGEGLVELVTHMSSRMKGIRKIAVAGGVQLDTMDIMKRAGIDIVIVGGAISKSGDIEATTRAFAQAAGR